MLQHLVKWAVMGALWRQARPFLTGTILAVLGLFVVDTLHAEFVEYVRLSRDFAGSDLSRFDPQTWLMASFLTKWLCFFVIVSVWALHVRRRMKGTAGQRTQRPATGSGKARARDVAMSPERDRGMAKEDIDDAAFDFLRQKKRLRARGDIVLDHKDDGQ